jgi:hypothetical protein
LDRKALLDVLRADSKRQRSTVDFKQ